MQIGESYMCRRTDPMLWRMAIANLPTSVERHARERDMAVSRSSLIEEIGFEVRPGLRCIQCVREDCEAIDEGRIGIECS